MIDTILTHDSNGSSAVSFLGSGIKVKDGGLSLDNTTPVAGTLTGAILSAIVNSDYKVLASSITYDTIPAAATITGFSWPVVAAGTYIFEVFLATTMTTTGGLTINFKLTTATLASINYNSYASTASDNTLGVSTQGTTTTDGTKVFDSKTSAYTYVVLRGAFTTTLGGTFAWQGTQNTSGTGADVSVILLNSYANLMRVA